jgi:hypothetical protein
MFGLHYWRQNITTEAAKAGSYTKLAASASLSRTTVQKFICYNVILNINGWTKVTVTPR